MASEDNTKRPRVELTETPKLFKENRGQYVFHEYHSMHVNNVMLANIYFQHDQDDGKDTKVKAYVEKDTLPEDEVEWLESVDKSLAEYVEKVNKDGDIEGSGKFKHCPIINKGLVKLQPWCNFTKRKKNLVKKNVAGFMINGTFMMSSVYKYQNEEGITYLGVNLIVPRKEKKCDIKAIPIPKKIVQEKEGDEDDE